MLTAECQATDVNFDHNGGINNNGFFSLYLLDSERKLSGQSAVLCSMERKTLQNA